VKGSIISMYQSRSSCDVERRKGQFRLRLVRPSGSLGAITARDQPLARAL
jgi:hypothetical protein